MIPRSVRERVLVCMRSMDHPLSLVQIYALESLLITLYSAGALLCHNIIGVRNYKSQAREEYAQTLEEGWSVQETGLSAKGKGYLGSFLDGLVCVWRRGSQVHVNQVPVFCTR